MEVQSDSEMPGIDASTNSDFDSSVTLVVPQLPKVSNDQTKSGRLFRKSWFLNDHACN